MPSGDMKMRQQPYNVLDDGDVETSVEDVPTTHCAGRPVQHRPPVSAQTVNFLDYRVARKLLHFIGKPPIQIRLWDGGTVSSDVDEPIATIHFRDRMSLYLTLLRPELYWGDLYREGRVDVDGDLVKLLDVVYRGLQKGDAWRWLRWLNKTTGHRKIRNNLHRAADNIHHHYDISNDFYRLWLDKNALQYTCAYFPDPGLTLEDAQIAKMRHVCRKLQLKPGDEVVEAGCGWGGFALYMAKNHGVTVKAYNISGEQIKYAREKARADGLDDRVQYLHDDYRNITGKFDVFVSVGMLEHVGPKHYPVLGQVIDDCLKPEGRGLIHSIGRNRPRPMNEWIERRIFPGSYPPTLGEMMDVLETSQLAVLDVENLRLHYALTLEAWLKNFEQHADRIEKMMDPQFVRCWRLYLAGSRAAFISGRLQLFQVLFTREENNEIAWSRAHQYTMHASCNTRHRLYH